MPTLGNFVHTQFVLKIPKPTASFAGKTIIVTGANGGLGKETAKHIIRLGASKVIFGCRSQSRGEEAKSEIEGLLKCSPNIIEVWEVDLESPASIKSFVDRANTLPRLDVLINNAGIQSAKFSVVYDTERTLAVNVIGTFLLAVQLVPKLRETARKYRDTPHMTFVSSALYDVAKYPEEHGDDIFEWFMEKSHVNAMNQYSLSKLLLLYATIRLSAVVDNANTTDSTPIVINSLDPCFCKTGLPGELTGALKVGIRIFEAIAARTAEEGARLVVQAASAGRETHGLYMRAGAVQEYAPIALDEKKATYVWELLCKKLEKLQPGILRYLD
ncbi:NAD(P)-binding protein [Coniochaeta ligniaria NRRL 30616]|uniref:NAD(P)-binding protein n=1 Tax=Coniochaeta ligniaria NRRL 30616 TaxID=1408157 RepID=A0A1J7JBS1_9PEZI|nr:NAD(P)-binding protein [Coniochaeta ligniaria NRRL 30616]